MPHTTSPAWIFTAPTDNVVSFHLRTHYCGRACFLCRGATYHYIQVYGLLLLRFLCVLSSARGAVMTGDPPHATTHTTPPSTTAPPAPHRRTAHTTFTASPTTFSTMFLPSVLALPSVTRGLNIRSGVVTLNAMRAFPRARAYCLPGSHPCCAEHSGRAGTDWVLI